MADPITLPPLPEPDISVPFLSEVRKVPQGDYYRADKVLPLLKQWPVLYEAAKAGHEQAFAEAQNAAAVSAAKDAEIERLRETAKALYEGTMRQAAEIAQLRAELIKSLADNAALRADAIDRQNNVVAPLRAEVAGLREDAERWQWAVKRKNIFHWNDDYKPPFVVIRFQGDVTAQGHFKTLNEAVDAARKGEA